MIVLISEALLQRSTATDGRILRDRFLQGFCVRLNKRKRTFLIATSVRGKQFRMMLGYWPLMSLDEARTKAMEVLRQCRSGEQPSRKVPQDLPSLREAYVAYCKTKGIKASSQRRYESFYRTHFGHWLDRPVDHMGHGAFAEHCHEFSQNTGKSLVELGRGVIGAVIKYVNAVYGLNVQSPFVRLAAAGLLPERTQPRARVLQESELPQWREAVDKLNERQRDYLYLVLYTGLRRNEARDLRRMDIDLVEGVLSVPETKTGRPHTLPITPRMKAILERRCAGLAPEDDMLVFTDGSPTMVIHGFEFGQYADHFDFTTLHLHNAATVSNASPLYEAFSNTTMQADIIGFSAVKVDTALDLANYLSFDPFGVGSLSSHLVDGSNLLFLTSNANGTKTNVWHWVDAADSSGVQATELTLVATLDDLSKTSLASLTADQVKSFIV